MKTTRSKGYRLEMINKVLPVHSDIPKIRLFHYNSLLQAHISTPFAIDRRGRIRKPLPRIISRAVQIAEAIVTDAGFRNCRRSYPCSRFRTGCRTTSQERVWACRNCRRSWRCSGCRTAGKPIHQLQADLPAVALLAVAVLRSRRHSPSDRHSAAVGPGQLVRTCSPLRFRRGRSPYPCR